MTDPAWTHRYRRARDASYHRWLRLVEGHETLVMVLGAVAFALATAAAAQVKLYTPLSPVPYTGQVFTVLLAGAVLGAAWGAASQGLYLGMGLVGVPVYAGGASGASVLVGSTGGYLLGFVAAAALVGAVVRRPRRAAARGLLVAAPLGLASLGLLAILDLAFLAERPHYLATLGRVDYARTDALAALVLLLGFFLAVAGLAAWVLGRPVPRERVETFLAMVVAILVVYALGALVFWATTASILGPGRPGFAEVVELAVLPFVPADLVKAALAAGAAAALLPPQAQRTLRGAA